MKYVAHKLLAGDLIQVIEGFAYFNEGDILLVLEQRKDKIWSGSRVIRLLHEGSMREVSGSLMNSSAPFWKILRETKNDQLH